MKKNRIYIILFLLLAIIACYFLYTKSNSTIRVELRDFAVSDTASIDKIFMADMGGKTIMLERKSAAEWMVNEKFKARQDLVNTLLYTMKSLEIRSPVGKNLYNQTMKLLASNSVKVEIYSKQQLIKTYYVGHPTMDNMGTFMYLEGSTVPFIMNIPGFNGYLTSRYTVNEADWKSKAVFDYNPRFITEVKVQDTEHAELSFNLKLNEDSTYAIMNNDGAQMRTIDLNKVYSFLSAFSNINYEMVYKDIPSGFGDSLLKAGPFKTIEVKLAGGHVKKVNLFHKKFTGETMAPDDDGIARPYDPDRFYMTINDDKNWYISQYYQWNKLLKTPSYFIPGSGTKK